MSAVAFSGLSSKIQLVGRVISDPTLHYEKRSNQQVFTFTIAVSRDGLPMSYNLGDYNYFLCKVCESLVSGEKVMEAENTIKRGDFLQVFGTLESKPYTDKVVKTDRINVRTIQAFTTFVLVVEWKDGRQFIANRKKMAKETEELRKVFGTEADINWVNAEPIKEQKTDGRKPQFDDPIPDY